MATTTTNNTVAQSVALAASKSALVKRGCQETQKASSPVARSWAAVVSASAAFPKANSVTKKTEALEVEQQSKDANDDGVAKSDQLEVASAVDEKGSERSEDAERSTDPDDDSAASYCETMSNWSEQAEIEQQETSQEVLSKEVPTAEKSTPASPTKGMRWADIEEDDEELIAPRQPIEQDQINCDGEQSPVKTPARTPLKKSASLFVPQARPEGEYQQALPFLPSSAVANAWQRWHGVHEAYGYSGNYYQY